MDMSNVLLAVLRAHAHACLDRELEIVARHYAGEKGLMAEGDPNSPYRLALDAPSEAKHAYCSLLARMKRAAAKELRADSAGVPHLAAA